MSDAFGKNALPDLDRRFAGVRRLYGKTAFERFLHSHVCVVGIGGVGSWAAEALARSAIGKITVIDLDMVAESNTNRQIHALGTVYGQAKTAAMRDRILAINPACDVSCIEDFVTPDNLDALLGNRLDYLIDAIDAPRTKAAMIAWCKKSALPLIVTGAAGGKMNPAQIELADLAETIQDPLLARTRTLLRKNYGFTRQPGKKMGVPVVFSREARSLPEQTCTVLAPVFGAQERSENQEKPTQGLNCGGYGSSMSVTATFGLFAASAALAHLASRLSQRK